MWEIVQGNSWSHALPLQNQSCVSVDYIYQRFELTFCTGASPYFMFWGGSSNTLEVRSNFYGKLHGGNFTVLFICLMNIFLRTALQVYFRLLVQAGPVSGWVGWTIVPFQMSSNENRDRMKGLPEHFGFAWQVRYLCERALSSNKCSKLTAAPPMPEQNYLLERTNQMVEVGSDCLQATNSLQCKRLLHQSYRCEK